MRPRVRSYGESSTATLSPARIRMKFLRILPETCARTWCLFSSSTRNIALGSGSITVAMTSMASSLEFPESPFFFSSRIGLAIVSRVPTGRSKDRPLHLLPRRPGHLFRPRQNPRSVGGNRHGVLEVRRGAAVRCFRHPLVSHANFRTAGVHHRLDGDDHALLQPRAASLVTVVRQVGLVVHLRSDPVPHELTHRRAGCPRASCRSRDPAIPGSRSAASAVPVESAPPGL